MEIKQIQAIEGANVYSSRPYYSSDCGSPRMDRTI